MEIGRAVRGVGPLPQLRLELIEQRTFDLSLGQHRDHREVHQQAVDLGDVDGALERNAPRSHVALRFGALLALQARLTGDRVDGRARGLRQQAPDRFSSCSLDTAGAMS